MRIVSGKYGGLRLKTKIPRTIRPTEDRTKESIFNILINLIDFDGLIVADLCAGVGSLGIEALSRGAEYCYFVEKNRKNYSIIKSLLQEIKIPKADYGILNIDALKLYNKLPEQKYDLIFTDPPYETDLHQKILNLVCEKDLLKVNGIIVIEHANTIKNPDKNQFSEIKSRKFGSTIVTILQKLG